MKRIGLIMIAVVAGFSLLYTSCKKDGGAGTGTLSVYMKDAPAAFEEVWVEVTDVEVHTEADGWVSFDVPDSSFDLLKLRDSAQVLLATSPISAGKVTQVRLILSDKDSVKVAGVMFPLTLSSQDETGLKVNINQDIVAGTTYKLVLDFDAEQSVHLEGTGDYKLKPVITAQFE